MGNEKMGNEEMIAHLRELISQEVRAKVEGFFRDHGTSQDALQQPRLPALYARIERAREAGRGKPELRGTSLAQVIEGALRIGSPPMKQEPLPGLGTFVPAKGRKANLDDPRIPEAGAVIVRTYDGRKVRVEVLEHGFKVLGGVEGKEGHVFESLSQIVFLVTGQRPSAFEWFGLRTKQPGRDPRVKQQG